jgi:TM2 domain-containing membrane protein YozV
LRRRPVLITWIYQFILLLFCAVLVWEIVDEKKFSRQLTVVIVLVPMLLRLFMIK